MSSIERHVRHLHMQVADMASSRAFLPRMENALRCASLPDRGARLLLVRRLALGPVAADVSHARLVQLIEERMADTSIQWVPGGSTAAESAGHVVFASALDARLMLAKQLLQGLPCKAWYWRAAVPELKAGCSVPQQLESISHAIAGWPEAAVALPIWQDFLRQLQMMSQASITSPSVVAQPPICNNHQMQQRPSSAPNQPDVTEMSAIGGRLVPVPAAAATTEFSDLQQSGRAGATVSDSPRLALQDKSASAPADTLSNLAMKTVAATDERHGQVASRQQLSNRSTPRPDSCATGSTQASRPSRSTRAPAIHSSASESGHEADTPATVSHTRCRAARPTAPSTESRLALQSGWKPAELPPASSGARSQAGGLLFLLPLLARMGLPAWCQHDPGTTSRLAHDILDLALARLRVATDDPVRALLATARPIPHQGEQGDLSAFDPTRPPVWLQATWLRPRRPSQNSKESWAITRERMQPDAESAARCWLHATRCWLRRVGGIGLASLVCRSGWVAWTSTHIDVHFRLDDADLRVRRLGLDIDPGWLPWFGRVVNFHYGHCIAPPP